MADVALRNAEGYREKLLQGRDEILESIRHQEQALKDYTQANPDDGDEAMSLQGQQDALCQINRLRRRLQRTERAIERLESDFGLCSDCEHDIEKGRLEHDPTVERCYDCQDFRERKEAGIRLAVGA